MVLFGDVERGVRVRVWPHLMYDGRALCEAAVVALLLPPPSLRRRCGIDVESPEALRGVVGAPQS